MYLKLEIRHLSSQATKIVPVVWIQNFYVFDGYSSNKIQLRRGIVKNLCAYENWSILQHNWYTWLIYCLVKFLKAFGMQEGVCCKLDDVPKPYSIYFECAIAYKWRHVIHILASPIGSTSIFYVKYYRTINSLIEKVCNTIKTTVIFDSKIRTLQYFVVISKLLQKMSSHLSRGCKKFFAYVDGKLKYVELLWMYQWAFHMTGIRSLVNFGCKTCFSTTTSNKLPLHDTKPTGWLFDFCTVLKTHNLMYRKLHLNIQIKLYLK